MKFLLASSALAVAFAISPAFAQKPPTAESTTKGTVTVQGVEPSKVLGAIDTEALVEAKSADAKVAVTSDAPQTPPPNKAETSEVTTVENTPTATVETKTEI